MHLKKYIITAFYLITLNNHFLEAGKSFKSQKNEKYQAKKFDYLRSKAFSSRFSIAAQWVKDCDIIIEIGGGNNSIDQVIRDKTVIVIDPAIKRKEEKNLIYFPKNFEYWNNYELFDNKKYAVVILGMDLKLSEIGWKKLFDLINKSEKTVIEYSTTFKDAKKQKKHILNNTNKSITQEKELDFSGSFNKEQYANPYRKIICLENVREVDSDIIDISSLFESGLKDE